MTNQTFPTGFPALTPSSTITLLGDDGTQNGTITVAQILALVPASGGSSLAYIGPWAANTAYAVGNVITNAGSSYVVTTAFTSGSAFSTSNLGLLAEAGANGAAGAAGPTGAAGAAGVGVSSFSATQSTVTAGQPSTVTVTATMTDGTTEEYTYQAPPGAKGASGSGSGGSDALVAGEPFQATGVMTNVALTEQLASMTLSASGAPVGVPGSHIIIEPEVEFQEWVGVGGAVTEAACYCLMEYLTAAQRTAFLTKMFGTDGMGSIRICFGSSDYGVQPYYTYCDDWDGVTVTCPTFTIAKDSVYVLPVLQEIVAINPDIWIHASVWSPPPAMKDSGTIVNGNFLATTTAYTAFANYLVLAIQAYNALGIRISAVSAQNEPQGSKNGYPCCGWTSAELVTFTGTYLGPALIAANLGYVEIIAADTSWGSVEAFGIYAIGDATASMYCNSVGYHGYNGSVTSVPSQIFPYNKYDSINTYFTEWISGFTDGALFIFEKWCTTLFNNMIRYGARGITLWCIALDQNGAPYEESTTTSHVCRGMVTVPNTSTGAIVYNSDYLIFAHLSKFVKRGAKVIKSNVFSFVESGSYTATTTAIDTSTGSDVTNIAFKNPDGSIVVFLWNPLSVARNVVLTDASLTQSIPVSIPAQTCSTITWGAGDAVSTAATFTAPSAPTLGTPTNNTAGAPVVPITAPTTTGSSDIGAYYIYEGTAAGAEVMTTPKYVVPGTATSFTAQFSSIGVQLYWVAQAVGLGGVSPSSNEVTGEGVEGGATAYTMTASSATILSSQMDTLTFAPNGTVGSAVTVTPAVSGVTGTFSPTTITFASGATSSSTQTVTFTPSSSGTAVISATNSGSLTNPSSISITVAQATTTYEVAGNASVTEGTASTYTVTQGAGTLNNDTDVIPAISGITGTFTPASISLPAGSGATGTFTFTASSTGSGTMSFTNDGTLTNASSLAITAASASAPYTTYNLTTPSSSVTVNNAVTFTVAPGGGAAQSSAITITPAVSGVAGTFSPTTVTLASGSAASQTFTFTPTATGTAVISTTNSGSLTNPSSVSLTVSAASASLPAHYLQSASGSTSSETVYGQKACDFSGGVIDAQIWTNYSSYAPSANLEILGDYAATGGTSKNQTFGFILTTGGLWTLQFRNQSWTAETFTTASALTAAPTTGLYLRAVVNATTSSFTTVDGYIIQAAQTVSLYTSTDGVKWTAQTLSSGGTSAAYTSTINSGTSSTYPIAGTGAVVGSVYKAKVYGGPSTAPGTTLQYDPDFTVQSTGATSFTDSAGVKWTVSSGVSIA